MAKRQYFKAVTPRAVVAFGYLHKPDTEGKFADGKYKCTLVIDADDPGLKALKEEAVKAAKAEWPKRALSQIKFPFNKGEEHKLDPETGEPREEFRGKILINVSSKHKPGFVDAKRQPLPESVEVRSGDVVKASVAFNTGLVSGKPTVGVWLNNIQLLEKRSGGGGSAADDFEDEDGYTSDTSDGDFEDEANGGDEDFDGPTDDDGLDDEIPF